MWDLKIGKKKCTFLSSFIGHNNWVMDAALSPENRLVASICEKSVRLWDFTTQKEFLKYSDSTFHNKELCFHPDGNYLAVGGHSKHIKIWDVRSHRLIQDFPVDHLINSIHFHPTGNYIACASDHKGERTDATVHIYDIRQVRSLFQIDNLDCDMKSIRFSNDGSHFVTGGSDALAYVWKTNFWNYEKDKEIEKEEQFVLQHQEADKQNIGGSLTINDNKSYKEATIMENLSLVLENFVSKINVISDNILDMEKKLTTNENNTKKLINFIRQEEKVDYNDPIKDLEKSINSCDHCNQNESINMSAGINRSNVMQYSKAGDYSYKYLKKKNFLKEIVSVRLAQVVVVIMRKGMWLEPLM